MGWTTLDSDQNDTAMDDIIDLQEAVNKQVIHGYPMTRPMIERELVRMAKEMDDEFFGFSGFWGLLVAARKAFPNVFTTGLLSPKLRTLAQKAFMDACSNETLSQFSPEDHPERLEALEREKSALLPPMRRKQGGAKLKQTKLKRKRGHHEQRTPPSNGHR